MSCHAPHKNQRQVLLLPWLLLVLLLRHGLLVESPLGSPEASLLIWFVGSAGSGGGTHAPCWNSSWHFVMLFLTILYSLLLALTYFLSRAVNKTKNHFRCNVAFFVFVPEMECVPAWVCSESRRSWPDPTWPGHSYRYSYSYGTVAWNLSLSTHHLHFEHKQQEKIPSMLLNAIKNNITRMRAITAIVIQKTAYYMPYMVYRFLLK